MYVNKVVFQESDEFTAEEFEILEHKGIICHTDYGTTEILASTVQDELSESENEDIIQILNDRLGTDVMDLIKEDELDFILVV